MQPGQDYGLHAGTLTGGFMYGERGACKLPKAVAQASFLL